MKGKLIAAFTIAIVIALGVLASAATTRANVYRFMNGSQVGGAWSVVATSEQGTRMTLHTSDRPAGHAVTVWWVVFNEPQNCTHPEPALGLKCSAGDLPPFGGTTRR